MKRTVTCIECYFLQFYNNLTMLRRISNAPCAHLLCTSRVAALWAATRIHPSLTQDSKVYGLPTPVWCWLQFVWSSGILKRFVSIIFFGRWMLNLWPTNLRVAGFKHQSSDLVEKQVEFLGIFRFLAIAGNATRLPPPSVSHQASRLPVECISACKKQTASITSV